MRLWRWLEMSCPGARQSAPSFGSREGGEAIPISRTQQGAADPLFQQVGTNITASHWTASAPNPLSRRGLGPGDHLKVVAVGIAKVDARPPSLWLKSPGRPPRGSAQ